jgi:hypothetical protein
MQTEHLMAEFEDGRTDLVGPLLEAGIPANFQNQHGVSLIRTCAYYGGVSAMRGLLARGASLQELWSESWIECSLLPWALANVPSSVITLKPAIRYQFKTGQRGWPKT